ncbi:hypothetical protein [Blastopirellula marina]|uniref:O-antigen ligase-related domain-containing protein n=1 Tax=Blastopirellula marina TaxID=124 RepID=A0A2S8GNG2_9BACT|nr:hypothetical protein [Blastopirellula marina]PQO45965.1 hypothetical protein C5Y93_11990 [Blastopirellula marina]
MNTIADVALIAWPIVAFALFLSISARTAMLSAIIVSWLFLPIHSIPLPLLPDLNKTTVACGSIFACILIFDSQKLTQLQFKWYDLACLVLCICPFASSLINDLGAYDGLSASLLASFKWGLPYLIGRLSLRTTQDMREFAIAIFLGGVIYIPFCLYEIKMSPQLHATIYGMHQHSFAQTVRFGGWRPTVFMEHGLMVSAWMASATLCGYWLWRSGALAKLGRIPVWSLVISLLATTILCKSTGALILLAVGVAVLELTLLTQTRFALIALLATAPLVIVTRTASDFSYEGLVDLVANYSAERAESLEFRFRNEDILIAKALQHPLFGWGGWGDSRVYDDDGNDISVTDGMWIIILGTNGLVGLTSLYLLLLTPPLLMTHRFRASTLASAELGPSVSVAICITLFAIDCIPNAMFNPVFIIACGGIMQLQHLKEARVNLITPQKYVPPRRTLANGNALPVADGETEIHEVAKAAT